MKPASRSVIARVLGAVAIALLLAVAFDLSRGAFRPARAMTDISGTSLAGEAWTLSGRRGKGPVLVNFFATWCGPCRMEFPELVRIQEKYRAAGFQVVAISDEPPELLRSDPDISKLPFIILPNKPDALEAYGVKSIPQSFFFDRDGKLVREIEGYDAEALKEVEKHLERESRSASAVEGAR